MGQTQGVKPASEAEGPRLHTRAPTPTLIDAAFVKELRDSPSRPSAGPRADSSPVNEISEFSRLYLGREWVCSPNKFRTEIHDVFQECHVLKASLAEVGFNVAQQHGYMDEVEHLECSAFWCCVRDDLGQEVPTTVKRYGGHVKQFGNEAMPLYLVMETDSSGFWSAGGLKEHCKITRAGTRILFIRCEGETDPDRAMQFEGTVLETGEIKGVMSQGGARVGVFDLAPKSTELGVIFASPSEPAVSLGLCPSSQEKAPRLEEPPVEASPKPKLPSLRADCAEHSVAALWLEQTPQPPPIPSPPSRNSLASPSTKSAHCQTPRSMEGNLGEMDTGEGEAAFLDIVEI